MRLLMGLMITMTIALFGAQANAEPATAAGPQPRKLVVSALLLEAQANAERFVRQVPAGLTNAQVWGIAAGIVAGGIIADLLGASGLVTLGLAAGGGAMGNWLLSS
jgi:hypothetical protein